MTWHAWIDTRVWSKTVLRRWMAKQNWALECACGCNRWPQTLQDSRSNCLETLFRLGNEGEGGSWARKSIDSYALYLPSLFLLTFRPRRSTSNRDWRETWTCWRTFWFPSLRAVEVIARRHKDPSFVRPRREIRLRSVECQKRHRPDEILRRKTNRWTKKRPHRYCCWCDNFWIRWKHSIPIEAVGWGVGGGRGFSGIHCSGWP